MKIEKRKADLVFSTHKEKLDIALIHRYLSDTSYWSKGIPIERVEAAVQGSLCFAVYNKAGQIAFARAVTDFASMAYLADVFVLEAFQGQGVGMWMMSCVMECLDGLNLRRVFLATWDAHTLYQKYGFTAPQKPEIYMEKVNFTEYPKENLVNS